MKKKNGKYILVMESNLKISSLPDTKRTSHIGCHPVAHRKKEMKAWVRER
jgi:hypothetical protein